MGDPFANGSGPMCSPTWSAPVHPTSNVLGTSSAWSFSRAATFVHIDHGTTSPTSCILIR